jgi:hypothetical protein
VLPDVATYKPSGTGESPLATITDWLHTTDPETGKPAVRETNTMPQWAGSCWYYLRFIDPRNPGAPVDPAKEKYWMPVDLYVGGAEHAVLHLLYARFWHKVLFDCGVVSTPEPFRRLVNQGMILGEDNQKMSKSRGNVVNPDHVIREYGADALRLYEMFMGPLEAVKPWSMRGVEGVYRWQAARPGRGRARCRPVDGAGGRQGGGRCAGPSGRQDAPQGDLRAGQTGEFRGRVRVSLTCQSGWGPQNRVVSEGLVGRNLRSLRTAVGDPPASACAKYP